MRIIDLHCYPNTKEWIACHREGLNALRGYLFERRLDFAIGARLQDVNL